MIGYLDAPEATDEVLRGGWLRTGDLAVVDADGYLTIVDRAKDLIVSGGENIASVEVEQALELHPAVREAAVVGVPDDRWGEVPRAFVSLVARRPADGGRADRVGPRSPRRLQGAEVGRDPRRAPQGRHRQDRQAEPPGLGLA